MKWYNMEFNVTTVVVFLLNGLMGVAMWLLKTSYTDLKDQVKETRINLEVVKDASFKREDFKEFKDELWRRFDKLEQDFNQKLQEAKHGT